jgi:hypothetical protein
MVSDFFDESVRINQVIWLTAAICDIDALPESLDEGFLEDMEASDFRRIFPDYPKHDSEDDEDDDYPDACEYAQWLLDNRKFGYLVAVQTPVREPGDTTFSWGYFSTKWIYVEEWNEEEVARLALGLKNTEVQ